MNLYQNYHRDYNPNLGRYLQTDPIGLAGGINTYGYAGQSPLVFMDELGLQSASFRPRPPRNPIPDLDNLDIPTPECPSGGFIMPCIPKHYCYVMVCINRKCWDLQCPTGDDCQYRREFFWVKTLSKDIPSNCICKRGGYEG
ncbi:RHS repeat domain-containing protein [Ostreibacterium oceani]|uniref:RHS repeat-associated protein n=1 Tax=Ostreibacterium oceani TaxID=2654998 RepID=A0A6N7EXC0_9GAMM|nr:hypothetical protein [Ostreibacterium oceani]